MADSGEIKHVSDTALWVATYRAEETNRPNALFRDPLAHVLAGERGFSIAARMPYPQIMSWVLVIRTIAIDRLITRAIESGVDCVLNLGAGLDTRPYRMTLPESLRWIEVDFPHMVSYKSERVGNEKPVCGLERISADLSDRPMRKNLFNKIGSECKKALVIAEGVIPYLSSDEAQALSEDLYAVSSFQYWIQDYRQGSWKQWAPKKMMNILKDAPLKFDQKDWISFFMKQGWVVAENINALDEARRVRRPFPLPFPWNILIRAIPQKKRENWQRASGYIMYSK